MKNQRHTDPQLVALRFEPSRLTLARELRSATRTDIAEKIGKTPSAITQLETGQINPDPGTVARLALVLEMPVGFFGEAAKVPKMDLDSCHFRSLRNASQYKRRQALAAAQLVHEIVTIYEDEGIRFPHEQLSAFKKAIPLDKLPPEKVAEEFRNFFEIGMGPLENPIAMLEYFGVLVLPLDRRHEEVDAFSTWSNGRPIMFLVTQGKPASRVHFDAAHELGHLILHDDADPGATENEEAADRFAGGLLLPSQSFSRECPSYFSMPLFRALKKRWRVSIAACVYRAHDLGLITKNSFRNAFVKLNKAGWRKEEPDEWELQMPRALRLAMDRKADVLPFDKLAERVALHEPTLKELLGGI